MERLTKKYDEGSYGIIALDATCTKMACASCLKCEKHIGKIINRVGAYEDTGLEPKEINKLEKENDELYEKLNYYQTAGNNENRITRKWQFAKVESWENYSMKCVQRLTALEDLEEQGLLIKPLCRFNENTVYYIDKSNNLHYGYIEEIKINEFGMKYTYINSDNEWDTTFTKEDIGKTVFLTREEAEKHSEEKQ